MFLDTMSVVKEENIFVFYYHSKVCGCNGADYTLTTNDSDDSDNSGLEDWDSSVISCL